ncbi:MAG: restriction endonuclease subunit S [Candidatus Methanoperedens sp.]
MSDKIAPKGWEVKRLGEVCEVIGGGTPSKANNEFYGGDILWATVRDMKGEIITDTEYKITKDAVKNSSTNIIPKGNVIIATRVGLGKICLIEHDTAINQDLRGIVPINQNRLSVDFLYRWFQSIAYKIVDEGTGATVQGVKLPFIKSLPIPLPPLPEQKRIVAILDETFESITKAKENAEKNLNNAKEIFESCLQSVFENKGEGWEEKKLVDICEIKPPKSEARNKLKETDVVSFVPMEDLGINQKIIIPEKERTLKEVEGSYTYFANDDVLLAKITPCFENGKLSIAKNLKNNIGFGSSEYIVFRTNKNIFSEYLYYFLLRSQFREEGAKRMMGAVGHKRVSKEFIENYMIALPSLVEQQSIVSKLDALSTETKKLEAIYTQKLADLEELKKSILAKAFNGELTEASA